MVGFYAEDAPLSLTPPVPFTPPTPSDSLTNPTLQVPVAAPASTSFPLDVVYAPGTPPDVQAAAQAVLGPHQADVPPPVPPPAPPPPAPPAPAAPAPAPQVDVNGTPQTAATPPPATQTAAAVGPSTPLPSASSGNYVALAWDAALRNNLDPNIFVRQLNQESGFRPFNADGSPLRSPAGAIGIGQFMPATARGLGLDPTDPIASIEAAAKMMAGFVQQFGGDMGKALAAYNAGPGAVQKYGGIPPYAETQSYVKTILGDAAGVGAQLAQRAQEGLGAAGQAVGGVVQAVTQAATAPVRSTQDILNQVQPFLGQKYVWGGASPTQGGTDCSGFVSYLLGMPQRGSTTTLYGQTSPVQGDPQPGDLVFWNMGQGDMHLQHVGMYMGNGQIVQDGGTQSAINIGSVGQQIGSPPEFRRMGAGGLPAQLADPTTPGHPGSAAIPQQPRAQNMAQFIQQHQAAGQGMPTDTELGNFVLSQPAEQTAASVGQPQPIQQPSSPFDVVGNIASGLGNAVSGAVNGVTGAVGGLFGRGGPGGQPPTDSTPAATTSPFPGLPQLPTGMPPEGGGYGVGGPLLPGEAASAFAPVGQAVTGLASSPLLPTNLTNAGLQAAGQVIAPFFANPLDAAQTYTEIQRRYGGGIDPVTGRFRAPDFSNITPEDEQALANATMAVGGVATPSGEGGSDAIRAMTGGVSDRIPGILGGTGGIVADSPAIRQVVENAAPVSANADRFYHGTGSDFPSPNAARFDPNGLFGPGYYVTSDPRVAGGVVDTAPGSTFPRTTGGYAESQMPSFYHDMREAQEDADYYRNLAAGRDPNYPNPTPEQIDKWSFSARESERRAAGLARNLPDTGPNVRAVDVPKNLNLLDVDAPAPAGLIDRVRKQVGLEGAGFDVQDHLDGLPQKPTAQDVWQAINAGGGGERDYPNAVLQAIGYDGIRYEGGKRIPLADQAGQPIEHTAVVVFPEALDKLTNATAGTRGGFLPDLAGESAVGRIAGRAAIGGVSAGAQQAQQPGATPQDIALAALQGAALGVGRETLLRNLPAGARLSATLARAVEDQGGVRPPQDLSETPAAAAPVSGTAGGNLPVEQIPEVQRVREAANPPPQVNPADNGLPPPPGESPRPVSTNPDDFDANVRAAVEQEAKQPGSFWQVLNALHSGNVVMGPFTLGKVAANTMFQPTWNLGTQTARDLLTLKIDRAFGRSVGAGQALWSIGNDFMDGFGQAMAGRTTSSIPMVDHFLQAQHAVGGALHAGMQNVAAEAVRRMELGAAAGEQVAAQGGRGIEGIGKIADLVRDSSSLPDEAVFRAADMADRAGLRSPAGAVQQTVQNMLNQAANTPAGAVANFLLPVFRIGAQATARGIEASPFGLIGTGIDVARAGAGFGPYAKGFSQYGEAVTPLADRLTSNLVGTALTAFLASKSLDGTITGTGPDDPRARANLEAQGWRPESVLVPGVGYMSYSRLPEQLRVPLELAGAFGDSYQEHKGDPQGMALRLAQEVGKTMAQGMPGISTLADIGGILKGDPYAVGYLVGGSAGGYIPGSAILGNVATAMDPLARKIPTTQGFGAAIGANIEQNIPGLREQLQARTSVLGQPMPNPAAGLTGLLPWRTPGEIAPGTPGLQALKVLNANGVTLGAAPKTVTLGNGSRVDLTDDEQQQYEADRAVLLDQMTSGLAGNQQFAAAPGAARKQVLDRLIRQADTVAGRQVVGAIAQGGDFASRLQGPKRLEEPVPAIRPPLALTELNSTAAPTQATRGSTLPLTSDLATLDPAQQEQLRRQLAATP